MPRAARPLRDREDGPRDDGMSLVEVMVAMALFVLGSLSLLVVLTSSASGSHDNRSRLTAANLAASDIDEARTLAYGNLQDKITPVTVDGRRYTVVREVEHTPATAAQASTCLGSGSTRQLHKRVSTRVEPEAGWRGKTTTPVRSDTLVRSPVFDPAKTTEGAIGLLVLDRTGATLSGMSLQVSASTRTTDGRGCVYFDGLPAGTYTVNVVTSGWVTVAGTTSITMTVRNGQISSQVLRIGRTARITVATHIHDGTAPVNNPGLWAWPTSGSVTARLASPDRATPTRFETTPQPLSSLTAEPFWDSYPQPAGYEAFLNPCSVPVRTASEPATSPRVVVPLRPVRVNLTHGGSSEKARNRTVVVERAPGVDCGEPPLYAAASSTTTSTCSNDCNVHFAMPSGTWRFKVLAAGSNLPEKSLVATVSGGYVFVSIDLS